MHPSTTVGYYPLQPAAAAPSPPQNAYPQNPGAQVNVFISPPPAAPHPQYNLQQLAQPAVGNYYPYAPQASNEMYRYTDLMPPYLPDVGEGVDTKNFNTRFFDCCEHPRSCFEATFCPWCQVSQQYHMLTSQQPRIHWCFCAGMLFCDVFFTYGLAVLSGSIFTRNQLRRKLQLTQVNCCLDSMLAVLFPCAVSQNFREMCIRGQFPGGGCVDGPYRHPRFAAPPRMHAMGAMMAYHPPPPPLFQYPAQPTKSVGVLDFSAS